MRKYVLVIEDNKDVSLLIKTALSARGYEVFVADDGKMALEKLSLMTAADHLPCLILCDLQMPVMDGWEFVEAVGKISEVLTVPIVIHSADDSTPTGYYAMKKPTVISALLDIVFKHCGVSDGPVAVFVDTVMA